MAHAMIVLFKPENVPAPEAASAPMNRVLEPREGFERTETRPLGRRSRRRPRNDGNASHSMKGPS